ncbi:MAG TPA: zinc ribbon domain-containing protein [Pyrinomonadaceae bacterium]
MYCSSCGAAAGQGLSFCSNCGAKLGNAKGVEMAKRAELFPDSLIWAIVSVFVVGLGGIIGLMAVMKDVFGFNPSLIIAFSLFSFAMMFMVEGVLVWLLLSRRSGRVKEAGDGGRVKQQETKELDAAQARSLPEPTPSITEHTTRTLEPLYSERKSK